MSHDKDTKLSIENLFQDGKCPYCLEFFNSKLCLLPYSLITKTILVVDQLIIKDLIFNTHKNYGDSKLYLNYKSIDKINNAIAKFSYFQHSSLTLRDDLINHLETDDLYNLDSSTLNDQHNNNVIDLTTSSINSNSKLNEINVSNKSDHSNQHKLMKPLSRMETLQFKANQLSNSQNMSSKRITAQTKQSCVNSVKIAKASKQIDKSPINDQLVADYAHLHLVYDLSLAYAAAYKIKLNNKDHVFTSKLFKLISRDINSQIQSNLPKDEFYYTELNHTTSISKEIFLLHAEDLLNDWEVGLTKYCSSGCILASPHFKLSSNSSVNLNIQNMLLNYIRDVWTLKFTHLSLDKDQIIFDLQISLSERKLSQAYTWCNSQIRFIPQGNTRTHKSSDESVINKGNPPTLSTINDVLDSRSTINRCILMELSKHNHNDLYYDESTNIHSFYLTLTEKLINLNSGWQNKTSFHNEKQVIKLLKLCNFAVPETRLNDILNIEGNILQIIRRITRLNTNHSTKFF
jgi:hypothetical protein